MSHEEGPIYHVMGRTCMAPVHRDEQFFVVMQRFLRFNKQKIVDLQRVVSIRASGNRDV